MKKLLALVFILFSIQSIMAQDDDIQTLVSDVKKVTGFGGPFMTFSSLAGEFAHLMGGGGAVLLNDKFFFGGYGYGSDNNIDVVTDAYDNSELEFSNGGFWFGYTMKGSKIIHPSINVQSGWGTITLKDNNIKIQDDNVFVFTPTVEMEVNLTRFLRLGLGANYRLVTGVDLLDYTNNDFSGPGGFVSFKFGWYY